MAHKKLLLFITFVTASVLILSIYKVSWEVLISTLSVLSSSAGAIKDGNNIPNKPKDQATSDNRTVVNNSYHDTIPSFPWWPPTMPSS